MLIEFRSAEEPRPVGGREEMYLMCFKSCSFRMRFLFSPPFIQSRAQKDPLFEELMTLMNYFC